MFSSLNISAYKLFKSDKMAAQIEQDWIRVNVAHAFIALATHNCRFDTIWTQICNLRNREYSTSFVRHIHLCH